MHFLYVPAIFSEEVDVKVFKFCEHVLQLFSGGQDGGPAQQNSDKWILDKQEHPSD